MIRRRTLVSLIWHRKIHRHRLLSQKKNEYSDICAENRFHHAQQWVRLYTLVSWYPFANSRGVCVHTSNHPISSRRRRMASNWIDVANMRVHLTAFTLGRFFFFLQLAHSYDRNELVVWTPFSQSKECTLAPWRRRRKVGRWIAPVVPFLVMMMTIITTF